MSIQTPQSEQQLKQKYDAAIQMALHSPEFHLEKVNLEGEKLLVLGKVGSMELKNQFWDAVKKIDAKYADLNLQLTVDASLAATKPVQEKTPPATTAPQIHVVVAGETLSGIAKKFYGDASKYMKIFEANKDKLTNPDKIHPGQELKIPEA